MKRGYLCYILIFVWFSSCKHNNNNSEYTGYVETKFDSIQDSIFHVKYDNFLNIVTFEDCKEKADKDFNSFYEVRVLNNSDSNISDIMVCNNFNDDVCKTFHVKLSKHKSNIIIIDGKMKDGYTIIGEKCGPFHIEMIRFDNGDFITCPKNSLTTQEILKSLAE